MSIPSELGRRLRVWKISRYSKFAFASSTRVRHRRRSSSSSCILAQNDSTTAISKQSPIDPMDGMRPESSARRVNVHDVNCVPWSEWMSAPGEGCRLSMAVPKAFVSSEDVYIEWSYVDEVCVSGVPTGPPPPRNVDPVARYYPPPRQIPSACEA